MSPSVLVLEAPLRGVEPFLAVSEVFSLLSLSLYIYIHNSYAVLTKDPTRSTERAFLSLLRNLRKEGKITEDFHNKVRPSEGSSKPALFYGRVKLHKSSAPLRLVVATRGTATYALARELSRIGCSGRG